MLNSRNIYLDMNKYKKIYKLSLFNQIYSPIILFFYITIFIKGNVGQKEGQIFAAVFLFLPIVILMIINIFIILSLKELSFSKKASLLIINFIPLLSTILLLIFNNYFYNELEKKLNFYKFIKSNS